MKQQIISVLAASLFLAGSMVTSSAQAGWGKSCHKLYQKELESCAEKKMKGAVQAKKTREKLQAIVDKSVEELETQTTKHSKEKTEESKEKLEQATESHEQAYKHFAKQMTESYDWQEKIAIKCNRIALRHLFDCKADKEVKKGGSAEKEVAQVREELTELSNKMFKCSEECSEAANLSNSLEEVPSKKNPDEIWQQCQDGCDKGHEKMEEIMNNYLSTLKK